MNEWAELALAGSQGCCGFYWLRATPGQLRVYPRHALSPAEQSREEPVGANSQVSVLSPKPRAFAYRALSAGSKVVMHCSLVTASAFSHLHGNELTRSCMVVGRIVKNEFAASSPELAALHQGGRVARRLSTVSPWATRTTSWPRTNTSCCTATRTGGG